MKLAFSQILHLVFFRLSLWIYLVKICVLSLQTTQTTSTKQFYIKIIIVIYNSYHAFCFLVQWRRDLLRISVIPLIPGHSLGLEGIHSRNKQYLLQFISLLLL